MEYAGSSLTKDPDMCPKRSIVDAYAMLQRKKISGGCTGLIASVDTDNKLRIANIGDSKLVVLRREGKTMSDVFSTPVQQHYFNCPFQLGSEGGDDPEKADLFEAEPVIGDFIVAGTDGLYDNLFIEDIIQIIDSFKLSDRPTPQDLTAVSMRLCELAQRVGKNRFANSPFSKGARKAGIAFTGGKLDDTTIVMSQII